MRYLLRFNEKRSIQRQLYWAAMGPSWIYLSSERLEYLFYFYQGCHQCRIKVARGLKV